MISLDNKATYQLHYNHSIKASYDFSHLMRDDVNSVMTMSQTRLFQAVYKALDVGNYYTSEVHAFVVKEMKDILSDEVLSANGINTKVENGYFGMDIYYMRKVVEFWRKRFANREALAHFAFAIGDKMKNFNYCGAKYSTIEIVGINQVKGIVQLKCTKRGQKARWTHDMPANDQTFKAFIQGQAHPSHITETTGGTTRTLCLDFAQANRNAQCFTEAA